MSVWIGKTLGKVRIEKLLGRGGMAEVYLGMHLSLQRPVAVKLLHGYLEENSELFERFQREARVVAGLRHQNIIQVFDYDVVEERPYIVMEYVNGPSLGAYLRSLHDRGARMPLGMIRRLLPMLASALDYAHSQGVVHRDIKPANVLLYSKRGMVEMGEALPQDTEPLLADFGLVRVIGAANQTSSGLITGTPAYMSPEQARGEHADHRSDVYSLGVLLYEMLSGRVPFDGDTPTSVLHKVLHEPPAPIQALSPELQVVIDLALQKDPNNRFQSAGELSNAFFRALGSLTEADTLPPMPVPPALLETKTVAPQDPKITIQFSPRRLWWIPVALVAIILFAIFAFNGRDPAGVADRSATPTAVSAAIVEATSTAMPEHGGEPIRTVGVLRFQDVAAHLDGVTVSVRELPLPASETHYEVWLVGGEIRRSLGVLELDAQGNGATSFVDEQSRNLLARYDRMEITVEPSPDPSPNSSGEVAFSSAIPEMALMHVRHVLVSIMDTPEQLGLIHGLLRDATLIDEHANDMLTAFDAGDQVLALKNAEAMVNMIVGSQSPDYGDLDGDGVVTDPGDGYGMLLNGESPGYTEGVEAHTQYAMSGGDAPESVLIHGEHVLISIVNVEDWSVQLRDLCLAILADPSDPELRSKIVQAVAVADTLLKGVDLDGNERIDAIPGEGGAITAYQHAYYMADMEILIGAGQVMPAGPTPEAMPTRDPDY